MTPWDLDEGTDGIEVEVALLVIGDGPRHGRLDVSSRDGNLHPPGTTSTMLFQKNGWFENQSTMFQCAPAPASRYPGGLGWPRIG